eukprot:3645478-Pyramimonas_sp.AAC.1
MRCLFVLTWLGFLAEGAPIGLNCSDVPGAFDRVNSDRLLAKLRSWGAPEALRVVFSRWLGAWKARVAVGRAFSRLISMADVVFQGA